MKFIKEFNEIGSLYNWYNDDNYGEPNVFSIIHNNCIHFPLTKFFNCTDFYGYFKL